MSDAGPTVTCTDCGRSPGVTDVTSPTGIPWTWTVESDDEGTDHAQQQVTVRLLCAPCTREHSRSIEAKLDRDWW